MQNFDVKFSDRRTDKPKNKLTHKMAKTTYLAPDIPEHSWYVEGVNNKRYFHTYLALSASCLSFGQTQRSILASVDISPM